MISLIKSGAFDEFGDRYNIMVQYIDAISDKKKRLTLQNVGGLIEKNMFPSDFAFEIKVFNFNKYLRKFKDKVTDMITLDEIAYAFYEANFDVDLVSFNDGQPKIAAGKWKPIYDKYMAHLRTYIQANQKEMLEQYNHLLYQETWDKYATGSVEKWSMDSVSFYQDRHELEGVDLSEYGVINFQDFTEEPQVERSFKAKDGHIINMFRLGKIAGTVIDRNKTKNQITFINDSKSTNPDSTIKAVQSSKNPTNLIIGGSDKGLDYTEMFNVIKNSTNIKHVIITGSVSSVMQGYAVKENLDNYIVVKDFEKAVKLAYTLADNNYQVLLSPGTSSFDEFRNFEERGDKFVEIVESL
jgi:DNA polymerase-3 subunit alpha